MFDETPRSKEACDKNELFRDYAKHKLLSEMKRLFPSSEEDGEVTAGTEELN